MKPAPVAPLGVAELCRIAASVLPPGVLNFVCGPGPEIGDALVRAPEVDMVSFTGSTVVGARIQEAVAPRMASWERSCWEGHHPAGSMWRRARMEAACARMEVGMAAMSLLSARSAAAVRRGSRFSTTGAGTCSTAAWGFARRRCGT